MMLALDNYETGSSPDENVAPFIVSEEYLFHLASAKFRQQMAEELLELESRHLIEKYGFDFQDYFV